MSYSEGMGSGEAEAELATWAKTGATEAGAVVGDCVGSVGYQIGCVAMGATGATVGEGGMGAGMGAGVGAGVGAGGACEAGGPARSVLSWSST